MKKLLFLLIVLVCSSTGVVTNAQQTIVLEGKTFVVQHPAGTSKDSKTEYVFKDSKGVSYPIYLSSGGKAYIIKVSKKTGKEYKCYIPEIGKRINPSAYKDKETKK